MSIGFNDLKLLYMCHAFNAMDVMVSTEGSCAAMGSMVTLMDLLVSSGKSFFHMRKQIVLHSHTQYSNDRFKLINLTNIIA
ncbi:hypothetical protein BLOT_016819 [Blomia tropicalis]|nr:hypothetical protein BLOT_016819 [Blomia tropicalis]